MQRIKSMTNLTPNIKLGDTAIKAIERILSAGQRVELIPVKDGVKVVKVKRETVNCENIKRG